MNKKGQKGGSQWPIVVLVIAGLILFYPQLSGMLGGGAATDTTTDTTVDETDIGFICPVDSTTLGFAATDVDDPGTQVDVDARYWVEGVPQGSDSVLNLEPIVSPGDTLEAWFADGSAVYYGSYFDGDATVPCKGTYDVVGKLWTKDTGVSLTVYDEDNDLAQTGAAYNQSIGVGETVEMRVRIKGNHEMYFGNPEVKLDNLLAVEFSRTEIDSVTVTKDGVALEDADVPTVEDRAAGFSEVGFLMPKVAGSGSEDYFLIIKADDINDPSEDVTLKIYDADYFYNSNTGKIGEGWEDETNADVGVAVVDSPTAIAYLD